MPAAVPQLTPLLPVPGLWTAVGSGQSRVLHESMGPRICRPPILPSGYGGVDKGWRLGKKRDVAHNCLWRVAPQSSQSPSQARAGPWAAVLQPESELTREAGRRVSASRASKVLCVSRKLQNRWFGNLPLTPPACPPRARTHTYVHTHPLFPPPPTSVQGPGGRGPVLPELTVTHCTVTALISIQKGREELR